VKKRVLKKAYEVHSSGVTRSFKKPKVHIRNRFLHSSQKKTPNKQRIWNITFVRVSELQLSAPVQLVLSAELATANATAEHRPFYL